VGIGTPALSGCMQLPKMPIQWNFPSYKNCTTKVLLQVVTREIKCQKSNLKRNILFQFNFFAKYRQNLKKKLKIFHHI
jgi:hypothetical protein